MANVNNPNGFLYTSIGTGHPPLIDMYVKSSGFTVAIFEGDVVYLVVAGDTALDRPPIKPLGDGGTPGTTTPLGVALEFGAASTKTLHHVNISSRARYHAQDNDSVTGLLGTDMDKNADVDKSVAGSPVTKWSGHQIDKTGVTAVPAQTAGMDLTLISRFPDVFNAFGPHCRVICKFNQQRYNPNTVQA